MSLVIAPDMRWKFTEQAAQALEHMLDNMRIEQRHDGGLVWSIELDGHEYSIDIDAKGRAVAAMSDFTGPAG